MADVRSLFRQILHLQETPHRTALAFAVGVFIAFSPTYGLHMIMVAFCTWAFGLNFVNNPWTLIPILGATYWTGAKLLGAPDIPSFDWHDLSFMGIYHQVMPHAWPFFLGGTVLSVGGGLLSYPIAYVLIAKYRRARMSDAPAPLPPSRDLG